MTPLEPFIPWDKVRNIIKCKPEVWARIRRLNPDHRGLKPYTWPRGVPPRRGGNPINSDIIRPSEFIKRFGRDAYRSIPKQAFVRNGHRKFLTATYVMENFG